MVALPITGLAGAAIIARTTIPTESERITEALGTADFEKSWSRRPSLETLRSQLPPGTRIVSSGWLAALAPIVERNHLTYFSVEEFDVPVDQPPLRGKYVVLEGRAAAGPGEIAVHPTVLEDFGAEVGDQISPRPNLSLTITGTVARAGNLDEALGILGPGTLASIGREYRSGWVFDLPPGADLASVRAYLEPLGHGDVFGADDVLSSNQHNERDATGGAFAAAVLLLLATGLIAGAAFAVGARRQLRVLGLMGASGAEARHVRATVLMSGTTLGALGAIVGVGLGIAGAFVAHPHLDGLAGRFVGPIEIPYPSLAGAVLLGTLAATLAALGPARSAARLSVVQALSLRTPTPRRPGRLAAIGLLCAAAGSAVTAWAATSRSDVVLAAGIATTSVGLLVGIPLLVTWAGRIAGGLPTLARIATRDVARHGRRAGAAIAAASIALAAPVAIATLTLADEGRFDEPPYMAEDHLRIDGYGRGLSGVEAVRSAGETLGDAFPDAMVSAVVPAVALVERNGREHERLIVISGPELLTSDGVAYRLAGFLLIGGDDLLRVFHAEDGIEALDRGAVVGIGPGTVDEVSADDEHVDLFVDGREADGPLRVDLPATEAGETRWGALGSSELNYVVSPERAKELGLQPSSEPAYNMSLLFRGAGPLAEDDIERARSILQDDRVVAVTSLEDLGDDAGFVRTAATLAGMGLALAIVGVVVALLAAESRRDRAILVAIGASPRSRRAVAGLYAAVVGMLAGVLGFVIGYLPAIAFLFGEAQDKPLVVPWTVLAGILLGVPAIAGTIGALASRQPKAALLLRPIA